MYKKINFKDWEDNKPDTYLVDGKPTIITKDNTGVTQEGTLLNANNLNHLEDGIYNNSVDINNSNLSIYNLEKNIGNVEELVVGENLVDSINKVFTSASNNKEQLKSIVAGLDLEQPPPPNATMEDLLNILHNTVKTTQLAVRLVPYNQLTKQFTIHNLKFIPDILLCFTKDNLHFLENLKYYYIEFFNPYTAFKVMTRRDEFDDNAHVKVDYNVNNTFTITLTTDSKQKLTALCVLAIKLDDTVVKDIKDKIGGIERWTIQK